MIAMTRTLKVSRDGHDADVTIRVSWPIDDQTARACQWDIQWPDHIRSNEARGADALQARLTALQMIGAELYCSEARQTGRLSWTEEWIGYGFPVPPTIRDMLIGNDRTSV